MLNARLNKLRHSSRAGAAVAAERVLPAAAVGKLRELRVALKSGERKKTQRVFDTAATEPDYLPVEMLETLQRTYPEPPDYPYDPAALATRGETRAAEILALPGAATSTSFLELGCWDGMASRALQMAGKSAFGIDNRAEGFDSRAVAEGVDLRQMDAEHLEFADESFDFAFSYDAFEHFQEPDRVLAEISRVVKRGGHIWLHFGPIYLSPYGEHAYRSITVPYCHILWSHDVINDFARSHGLQEIDPAHVNQWRIHAFRALWDQHSETLPRVRYREHQNLDHLDLISQVAVRGVAQDRR